MNTTTTKDRQPHLSTVIGARGVPARSSHDAATQASFLAPPIPVQRASGRGRPALLLVSGLVFVLSIASVATLRADDTPGNGPKQEAVTGGFDFSILSPSLGPYIFPGTDGDLYLRHVPLVGKFTLAGKGVALDAKLHVDLSGEIDPTATGVSWFQVTITSTIDGVKTIIFEGQGSAKEVQLVATGNVSLKGRGPYAGTKLEFCFQETGPADNNIFTYQGFLTPAQHR